MSATLGGGLAESLQQLMSRVAAGGDGTSDSSSGTASVPVIVSEGRSYPIITHFLGKPCEWLTQALCNWLNHAQPTL